MRLRSRRPLRPGTEVFKEIKLVEHALHILDSETPDQWCTGIVRRKAQRPRVEMGGLHNHEAVSSPEVNQRSVAVQRQAKAVRENNNRQFAPMIAGADTRTCRSSPRPKAESTDRLHRDNWSGRTHSHVHHRHVCFVHRKIFL